MECLAKDKKDNASYCIFPQGRSILNKQFTSMAIIQRKKELIQWDHIQNGPNLIWETMREVTFELRSNG